jgi:MFS family permease
MAISKRTFFAGVFGNALEWYDFTAYAFFAPVLAKLFFPTDDPYVSLLITFSVFALGFLVRPLGGLLFGFISDRFGRRKALIISIIAMSFPTLFLGVLPTYATIGILAPLILTILRVVQGAAVSGEMCTSATYLIEHAGERRRGLAGSFVMCSAFLGMTVSSAMATLITHITNPQQLLVWGWRLPFIVGGVIGVGGLIIRLGSMETPAFQEAAASKDQETAVSVLTHLRYIFTHSLVWLSILLAALMGVADWFLIAYFNTFLTQTVGMPLPTVMSINLFILCFFTLLLPFMGLLSDSIGRKPVLRAGFIGFIIFSYPIFRLLHHGTITSVLIGEILFAIILAPVASIIPTSLAELFHVRLRNTAMALGYNLSQGLFGGTAPLIAILLVVKTGNPFAPSYYLIFCALISWWALSRLKESYKSRLQ